MNVGPSTSATTGDRVLDAFVAGAVRHPDPVLDRVLDDWAVDPATPLLLTGVEGSGRAGALCRFAATRAAAGENVVVHHAALMPADSETPSLLWHLLVQLRRIAAIPQWPPVAEADMRETLPNWLARACARGPVWLVLADLDVAGDAKGHLPWLPDYWPPRLHVAASAGSGTCAEHLIASGWRVHATGANPAGDAARGRDTSPAAVQLDSDTLATIAGLLAFARTPLDAITLAGLTGAPPPRVQAAIALLQPALLHVGPDAWAPAHPTSREALLTRYVPHEYQHPRHLEWLASRSDPLLAAAYFRHAGRRDQTLEALLQRDAIAATAAPEARMRWLAEWQALRAGPLVDALLPVLLIADQSLLLAAAELVDCAGEAIPADWLDRAATGAIPDLCARARLWQSRTAAREGDWPAAARHAQAALDTAQDDEIRASARHELARAAEGSGDLARAEALYAQALAAQESRCGGDSERLLPALANLIGVLRAANKLNAARPVAERALHIAGRFGPGHPVEAATCDQWGGIAYAGADFAAAESAYRDTLRIVETAFGPTHPATAAALHNLGTALDARRTFAEAEQCYRRALEIRESRYGRQSEETAATLHNLAAVMETIGKLDSAERLYRETTDTWEQLYGAEHPATLSSLTNLAGVLASRGAYADAEVCYRAAAEGWRRLVGGEHPHTLGALAELGRMYADAGKPELAAPLLEHVVEAGRRAFGDTDNHYVNSVCSLAALWRSEGRRDEARALVSGTLTGAERKLGLLAPAVQQLRRQLDALDEVAVH